MTITQSIRVELDPNRVPIPASGQRRLEPSFQDRLDKVSRQREPVPEREPPVEETFEAPERIAEEHPAAAGSAAGTGLDEEASTVRPQPTSSVAPEANPTNVGPRHAAAPKAAPRQEVRPSSPNQAAAAPSTSGGQALPTSGTQAASPAPQATVGPSMVRSSQTQTQPSVTLERAGPQKETARVSNARPGYRTLNNATVRMAELARDSIFRQIALRMNGEGGEMKILLDPPELGQLDLHMVVEKGGRVHLSLIAERPELALLLEKHLGELKQTLQSHGLSIGNTEVRGRGERPRNREHSQDFAFPEGPLDDGQDWSTAAFQRAGYITAEGLDFWV